MQKRGFHPTFLLFEGTCVAEKRKPRKPLKSMVAPERKHSSTPQRGRTCATLPRRCRYSKIACVFGAAASAAIFAGV